MTRNHSKPSVPEPAAEWLERFRRALLDWYRDHKRDLPWRRIDDPYAVWGSGSHRAISVDLSEIQGLNLDVYDREHRVHDYPEGVWSRIPIWKSGIDPSCSPRFEPGLNFFAYTQPKQHVNRIKPDERILE